MAYHPYGPLPRYYEVPPGLILISQAARKYNRSRNTIAGWVRRGFLQPKGRLMGHGGVGGGWILVAEMELEMLTRFRRRQQFPFLR